MACFLAFSLTTAFLTMHLIPLKLGVAMFFRLLVPNIKLILLNFGAVVVSGGGDQCDGGGGWVLPVLFNAQFVFSMGITCAMVIMRHIWGCSEILSQFYNF